MPVAIPVGAELDERSATAVAEKARRVFAAAGQDAGRAFGAGLGQADEGLRKFENRAKDTYDKVADSAGKLRSEEEKLQSLRDRGARNDQIVSQAERVERARRAEARAIRDATNALGDYERARDAADRSGAGAGQSFLSGLSGSLSGVASAGQEAADGFMGGFAGASALTRLAAAGGPIGLAFAGIATLGVVAGKQLADGLAEGLGQLQIEDVFRTRMGLDPDAMNRFGSAAAAAWTNGFGMSREANLSTIDIGFQAHLIDRNASEDQVQKFVERMDTVSRITGESQQSLALGARGLVSGGMVGSYTDAFDLILAAQEKGLNLTGDMMDTLNEYAINFKNLGLSGSEALGLINQMYESNIRNSDLAADSLREFSISANDGSTTTKAAFQALGFNAEDMGKRFAAGGDQAKEAFGAIMVALASIEDPQERTNVGLALFKTRWEEANTAIMAMDLNSASTGFTNINGKVDEATSALNDHANGWTNLGNTISNEVDKIQRSIADSGFGKWFMQDLPDEFGKFFSGHLFDDPPQTGTLPDVTFHPGLSPRQQSDLTDRPHSWGPDTPAAGPGMPYDDAKKQIEDAAKADGAKAKPSFDPSQYSVDAIPVAGAPGPLPVAGTPGVPMWGTGNDPFGKPGYGMYQVDPQRVYDAETSVLSARTSVENARIRVLELEAEGTATAQDLAQARNSVTMAERQYTSAQMKLAEAQQGTWKKMEGVAKSFSSGMGEIGAALDADLGISKGIPGIVENLVKAAASIAAAPLLGQLSAISQVNPIQGGYGLAGILGAQGVFGPQYTQSQYAQQGYSPSEMGPAALQPGYVSSARPGMPKPGETGRDFAHRVMMPFWQSQGLTVGDHQADQYGEHQNGALDIMVDSLAEGQKVLQQVLSDPNVYGAIFNNKTYGYGHGLTPKDYSAGHTGNPTQDHQDHVHAWYKPGGSNNITPSGGGMPTWAPSVPATTAAAPSYGPSLTDAAAPSLAGVPAIPGGMMPGMGMPQAAPFNRTAAGGIAPPAMPGGGGPGLGGGAMDMAMMAAGGLDMLAPGAGQAAQMGMKLANRAIQFGGQVAGIGASGLIETFLPSGSPLGNFGNSWFGKVAAGIASARPALPNVAAQQAPPNPNAQGQGQPGQPQPGQPVTVNYTNNQATEDRAGADIARHLEATNSPAGKR
ncbi:phage tail tape measure protein [Mycolicibacterium fortuitum]|uniref:phage tail tape measure protein n=1 Tax=Mycolicibacterium fortuitum TaxID=1766 RepID=UPI003AAD0643